MATTTRPAPETDSDVLADARHLRATADQAERLILLRATQWAASHPVTGPHDQGTFTEYNGPEGFRVQTLPQMAYDAGAEFGLALSMSHEAGNTLIHQAVELSLRLPLTWARVAAGEVTAWRARRIAEFTIGHPDEVAADIDAHVARIAHKVGLITLARLLDEARYRAYPEQCELEQIEELDRRRVQVLHNLSHTGIAHMRIDTDLKDIFDVNDTINEIAGVLKSLGVPETPEVLRAMAFGVLADPARALALLEDLPSTDVATNSDDQTGTPAATPAHAAANAASDPGTRPRRRMTLVVHLSHSAILGCDPVGRLEANRAPILAEQIREWCGRTDTHLTVTPVIDLTDHEHVEQYELPDRLKHRIDARDHTCTFPWCNRVARRCDHDHNLPFDRGGATCECNLAPLCRKHHRMKTHRGWTYTTIEPGSYLWHSPAGHHYYRDNTGTIDATSPGDPHPGNGCFHDDPTESSGREPPDF